MTKSRIIFVLIAMGWFILAGVFIAERDAFLHWLVALAIYAYVAHPVYCGMFGLTIYSPYSGSALERTEKNSAIRAVCAVIGLALMGLISIV